MSKINSIEYKIAQKVKDAGGRVFYVGGYVRDKLLNIENKDIDIEVHGIEPETLNEILKEFGTPLTYGKSFGIVSLRDYHLDIAMPRTETSYGIGHRDFDIKIDPYVGYEKAARRRDFTINALMQDVITDEILDYFNGLDDLKNGIIKAVDPISFIEDPLRVLRAAQFASRFNFKIDEETINLCSSIDITQISKERVMEELKKAFLKSDKPSIFFNVLRQMNQLDYWFKEIKDLINTPQDPIYHPEGDVYNHTMDVLDRSIIYKNEVSDQFEFEMLALVHDLGKVVTTETINGRIHAYGHEIKGLPLIKSLLNRLDNEKHLKKYLLNMTPLHMRLYSLVQNNSSNKSFNHLFDEAIEPKDLIYFTIIDKSDKTPDEYIDRMFKQLDIYEQIMNTPHVEGDDLIKMGFKPDKNFKVLLDYAHKMRLAGVSKQEALKQIMGYSKTINKS